ncbi:hypothetical protein MKEN_01109800 [Mycena kentingensis (nom. inval.)]|nr:hypothetical protein MKEN_01109800 [Mycena kentingensis (nom. inval.)]
MFLIIGALLTAVLAIQVWRVAIAELQRRRTIAKLPCPPSSSWILGNLLQSQIPPEYGQFESEWRKEYGAVYRIKGLFGRERLMVADTAAIHHIVNSEQFDYAPAFHGLLGALFTEDALLVQKGRAHRDLRGALNVGFNAVAVKTYQPIFANIAQRLSDDLARVVAGNTAAAVDLYPLLNFSALAAISEAIFGSKIEDLSPEFKANNDAIIAISPANSPIQVLGDELLNMHLIPAWFMRLAVKYPTNSALRIFNNQVRLADETGWGLIRKKMDMAARGEMREEDAEDIYSRVLFAEIVGAKPRNRITAKDLVRQTSIMSLAGQDTTGSTIAWTLLELARKPDIQQQLREELGPPRSKLVSIIR